MFVGDLVDRGPRIVDVLRVAMDMVDAGAALCVPGNHDAKLLKKLNGRPVQVTHGLAESLAQLDTEPPAFCARVVRFLESLPSHLVLDGGRLVVAHAGMKGPLQGRDSARVRDFALYGETTGETDQYGLPVRLDWAASYHGARFVAYGHTPVLEPRSTSARSRSLGTCGGVRTRGPSRLVTRRRRSNLAIVRNRASACGSYRAPALAVAEFARATSCICRRSPSA